MTSNARLRRSVASVVLVFAAAAAGFIGNGLIADEPQPAEAAIAPLLVPAQGKDPFLTASPGPTVPTTGDDGRACLRYARALQHKWNGSSSSADFGREVATARSEAASDAFRAELDRRAARMEPFACPLAPDAVRPTSVPPDTGNPDPLVTPESVEQP